MPQLGAFSARRGAVTSRKPTSLREDLEMEPERLTPGALSRGRSRALDIRRVPPPLPLFVSILV